MVTIRNSRTVSAAAGCAPLLIGPPIRFIRHRRRSSPVHSFRSLNSPAVSLERSLQNFSRQRTQVTSGIAGQPIGLTFPSSALRAIGSSYIEPYIRKQAREGPVFLCGSNRTRTYDTPGMNRML